MYKKPSSVNNQKKPPSRGNTIEVQQPQQKPKYLPAVQKQKQKLDKKLQTNSQQGYKSRHQQIVNIIKEYLLSHGYTRSFTILKTQKPLTKGITPPNRRLAPVGSNNKIEDQKLLIRYFQKGQRQQFFKHVNKWLSTENVTRLQFQLQIYFCIYSVHPMIRKTTAIEKSSLQYFKKFIQSRGSQITGCDQYLIFFSLPFIPKPHQNPGLAHVFTKEWINMLKQKVSQFIKMQNSKSIQTQSKQNQNNKKKQTQLQQIYQRFVELKSEDSQQTIGSRNLNKESKQNNNNNSQALKYYKKQLQEVKVHNQCLLKYIQKLSNSLQQITQTSKVNLVESNKKWFFFTKDLLVMCKKAMRGQKITQSFQKYEIFFGKNVDQIVNNADVSIFDKNSMMVDEYSYVMGNGQNNKNEINNKSNLGGNRKQQSSSQIDMVKIQTLFANAQDPNRQIQVLLLLKALKIRFSKLKNPFLKRQIIVQYSRHDICGITPQKYYIQKRLLVDGSERIKQFYLRLMNEISVDIYGIQYLTKSQKLIENLVNLLKKQMNQQTNCKRFILGILQKFSYPKKSRSKMISLGIIPLIFKIFQLQKQDISGYTLQYLTAMIMNLSLKKQSQKDFVQYKQQLISILMQLTTNQNDQIKNYANGSIYLLLSYKQIMKQALKKGLKQKIIQLLEPYKNQQIQQDSFCGQYQYILKRLTGQIQIDQDGESQDEEEDQPIQLDQFEEDDQEQDDQDQGDYNDQSSDYIQGQQDYTTGQELLIKDYMLVGPQALKQHLLTRSVLDQTSKKINNMTLSVNHSKRMDNIFNQKQRYSQQLQPQLDKLIHQNQEIVYKLNQGQGQKKML